MSTRNKPRLLQQLNKHGGGGPVNGWGSKRGGYSITGSQDAASLERAGGLRPTEPGRGGYSVASAPGLTQAGGLWQVGTATAGYDIPGPAAGKPLFVMPDAAPAESGVATSTPQPWERILDPASGGAYFYNSQTDESQWERPDGYQSPRGASTHGEADAGAAVADDAANGNARVLRFYGAWDVYMDADSGYEYYHNRETEEVSWEPPLPQLVPPNEEAEYDAAADVSDKPVSAEAGAELASEAASGVGPLAGYTGEELAAVAATLCYNRYKPHVPHPLAKHGPWELFVDPDTQRMYYCNNQSGESVWEAPPAWDDAKAYVPPLATFGAWQVYRDNNSLQEYYTNSVLNQTTWEVPAALAVQVRTVETQEAAQALEMAKAAEAEAARTCMISGPQQMLAV